MALNKNKFALSSGLTMGIVYIVCRIFVSVAPSAAQNLLGWWIHTLNMEQFIIQPGFDAAAFVGGFASAVVLSYIVAWIFVSIYNTFIRNGNK